MAVAVAALGGYGRRALCLHSDIDLLVVFGAAHRAPPRSASSKGCCTRCGTRPDRRPSGADADEALTIERDNPEFLLAQLDARLLAGDPAVFEQVDRRSPGLAGENREQVVAALLRLTGERHAAFNDTIYQLEPDVKESPGGLRDIVAARLLAALADDPAAIDEDALEQAENFLLRVRSRAAPRDAAAT